MSIFFAFLDFPINLGLLIKYVLLYWLVYSIFVNYLTFFEEISSQFFLFPEQNPTTVLAY